MAGLTHHFLLNPLVGQPFLGSEGEDSHDKIKAKRYGSGSGWSALYDLLESILAPRSNAGCRPSERQKIEAVSDVLITNDNIGEADNDEMAKVAASYWQVISIPAGIKPRHDPRQDDRCPVLGCPLSGRYREQRRHPGGELHDLHRIRRGLLFETHGAKKQPRRYRDDDQGCKLSMEARVIKGTVKTFDAERAGAGFRARLVTPSFITTVRPAKSN